MNCSGVLSIEAIERGRGAHRRNHRSTHGYVQGGQPPNEVGHRSGVHAVPNPDQAAFPNLNIELLAGHDRQELCCGGDATAVLEELGGCGVHVGSVGVHRNSGVLPARGAVHNPRADADSHAEGLICAIVRLLAD